MVQEVTTTSWGKRFINALVGIFVGIALIIGAFVLIFWNEGNSLHTAQALAFARAMVIPIKGTPIDPKNDLRLVYLSDTATTEDDLEDTLLGVSEKAIKLNRHVEMYQWDEEVETKNESQMGGSEKQTKTYTYKKTWSNHAIDSSQFKEQAGHENPSFPIKSLNKTAKTVTVGDFTLSNDLVEKISGETPIDLSHIDTVPIEEKTDKSVHRTDDGLFVGEDPTTPVIGDLKISETVVLPQTVSLIAKQSGSALQAYMAPSGKTISLLQMGQQSSEALIQDAESQNRIITWLLRLASLLMMMIGLALIMNPIVVLADVVPFLGSLVGFGTGMIAFVGGLILWTLATATAWFTVRPWWSVGLIILSALICYVYVSAKRRRQKI